VRAVLKRLMSGEISTGEAERLLRANALEEVESIAKLDIGRQVRKGIPEIVLAEGKRTSDLVKIVRRACKTHPK